MVKGTLAASPCAWSKRPTGLLVRGNTIVELHSLGQRSWSWSEERQGNTGSPCLWLEPPAPEGHSAQAFGPQ